MKRDRTLIAAKLGYVVFLCYFLQSNGVKQREIQALRKHEHTTVIFHVSGGGLWVWQRSKKLAQNSWINLGFGETTTYPSRKLTLTLTSRLG